MIARRVAGASHPRHRLPRPDHRVLFREDFGAVGIEDLQPAPVIELDVTAVALVGPGLPHHPVEHRGNWGPLRRTDVQPGVEPGPPLYGILPVSEPGGVMSFRNRPVCRPVDLQLAKVAPSGAYSALTVLIGTSCPPVPSSPPFPSGTEAASPDEEEDSPPASSPALSNRPAMVEAKVLSMMDWLNFSRSCSKAFPPATRSSRAMRSTTAQEMLCTSRSCHPAGDARLAFPRTDGGRPADCETGAPHGTGVLPAFSDSFLSASRGIMRPREPARSTLFETPSFKHAAIPIVEAGGRASAAGLRLRRCFLYTMMQMRPLHPSLMIRSTVSLSLRRASEGIR